MNKMNNRTFDEALLFYRSQRGLNQTKMAELFGVSFRFYQKLESGKSEPSLATLQKALEALGVSFEEFFARPTPKPMPAVIRLQQDPSWPEISQAIDLYLGAALDNRLLALYILTYDERFLREYEALDDEHAMDAAILKKIHA